VRDLENLRRMGAHFIRVYRWSPGSNHEDFLDLCYNGGDRPAYVLVNRWIYPDTDWNDAGALTALEAEWTTIARKASGLRLSATCDADLRDMRVRIERSGADLNWVTVAGGDAVLDLFSLNPDFTVVGTPEPGASEPAGEAHDSAPASRGALCLYRRVVEARWPLRSPTSTGPDPASRGGGF
jgi:hypothetical protein